MAFEIYARADILSLNIRTLLRESTRASMCEAHTREMQPASSCRECGRQRTLETGINVPPRQRYIKQQAPWATLASIAYYKSVGSPTRVQHATKLSSYFPCRSSMNSSTSFEPALLAVTFFPTFNLRFI